jgi:hypothetical protein
MKLGHNRRAALPGPDAARPPISRFREWQAGVVAFILGNAANFLSFGARRRARPGAHMGRRGPHAAAGDAHARTHPLLPHASRPGPAAPAHPGLQPRLCPGYAAQSLLSAIGCVQFVSNVVFASVVLKEQVCMGLARAWCVSCAAIALTPEGARAGRRMRDSACRTGGMRIRRRRLHARPRQVTRSVLAATACIVLGCVLLVSFGDHSSSVFTARDLLRLYAA